MITSLLVRCSYVWLFSWFAVSTTAIPFLYLQKGIIGAFSGCTYVVITATLAGLFSLVPQAVGRMCLGRKAQWKETFRVIAREHLGLSNPLIRMADFLLVAIVLTVTAIPVYGLYWTAGQHLAFTACSLGAYETGERISKAVRVSTSWNDETLVGLFDNERDAEPLTPGRYESEKTRAVNDAIANVYGFDSRQMARRFKQLGDNSLKLMRTSPFGSPEAAEAVYYAESRYLNALDIYRDFGASAGYIDTLAQLSYCNHLMGDRADSYSYFSEALSTVSHMEPMVRRRNYRSIYSVGRMMGIHDRHYATLRGPHHRGPAEPYVLWTMGLLALPGIVFLRLLMPLVMMSAHVRKVYRRLPEQTSVRCALSDLDTLAVTQLCLEQLDAADETTKVMLKLAETDDVTVVRTIIRTPQRQYNIA